MWQIYINDNYNLIYIKSIEVEDMELFIVYLLIYFL